LAVLHSGYAADAIAFDCFGKARKDRIWSYGYRTLERGAWTTSGGNFVVNGYVVASAFDHEDECAGGRGAKMGIITQEILHTFGAQNLFDPRDWGRWCLRHYVVSLQSKQGPGDTRVGECLYKDKVRVGGAYRDYPGRGVRNSSSIQFADDLYHSRQLCRRRIPAN
jgi:hypothetical protein